ncbi:Uncharacterised protein [Achromobacter xylosoxidans]|nr:Uncharacterised protein [Achromobacter xylosoxidans]
MRVSVALGPAAFRSTRVISLSLYGASTRTTADWALSSRLDTTR